MPAKESGVRATIFRPAVCDGCLTQSLLWLLLLLPIGANRTFPSIRVRWALKRCFSTPPRSSAPQVAAGAIHLCNPKEVHKRNASSGPLAPVYKEAEGLSVVVPIPLVSGVQLRSLSCILRGKKALPSPLSSRWQP